MLSLNHPLTHLFSWDPSPSPLPTVNHTCGWGRWAGGEAGWVVVLWTVEMNRAACMGRVSAHMYGSHLRFTHNPLHAALPSLMVAVMDNLVTDLFQVALRLLSSLRNCHDPWPLTPEVCPMSEPEDGAKAVAEGRGDMGIRANWEFCVWKESRATSSQVTTHSDLQAP